MQVSFHKKDVKFAFTLIEIMIVIVIIGIMAGVVISVINPQRQIMRSNEGIFKSNMTKLCGGLVACMGSGKKYDTGRCDVGTEINSFGSTSVIQVKRPSNAVYALIASGGSGASDGSVSIRGVLTHTASIKCTLECTVKNDFSDYTYAVGKVAKPGEIYQVGTSCVNQK